ncbi:MAG: glucose 1-dehydrogenase [Bacteroidota bacterium]
MSNSVHAQFDLQDKVAIVTGASKGIGAAIARGLAELGAKVVISSRKAEAVEALAAEFRAASLEATGIACHVGDPAQLEQLVRQTKDTYGGIDILINNAATNPVFGPIEQSDAQVFDKIMNVNVKACFLLANLCFPSMVERGGGSIIHVSSVEGLRPSFGLGLYSVSKAALLMLCQNQAKEWGKHGIRVNAICPGLIQTKFSAAIWQNEKMLQQVEQHLPLGRMAQPEEMVGLAVFLASAASAYCTGGVYPADGGHLLVG